jgi:hypothetical protein
MGLYDVIPLDTFLVSSVLRLESLFAMSILKNIMLYNE